MGIPLVTRDVARSIYYYAGGEYELPRFEDLPPTIQLSYIEEAEAAISAIVKHIRFLSTQAQQETHLNEYKLMAGAVLDALAETLER